MTTSIPRLNRARINIIEDIKENAIQSDEEITEEEGEASIPPIGEVGVKISGYKTLNFIPTLQQRSKLPRGRQSVFKVHKYSKDKIDIIENTIGHSETKEETMISNPSNKEESKISGSNTLKNIFEFVGEEETFELIIKEDAEAELNDPPETDIKMEPIKDPEIDETSEIDNTNNMENIPPEIGNNTENYNTDANNIEEKTMEENTAKDILKIMTINAILSTSKEEMIPNPTTAPINPFNPAVRSLSLIHI